MNTKDEEILVTTLKVRQFHKYESWEKRDRRTECDSQESDYRARMLKKRSRREGTERDEALFKDSAVGQNRQSERSGTSSSTRILKSLNL